MSTQSTTSATTVPAASFNPQGTWYRLFVRLEAAGHSNPWKVSQPSTYTDKFTRGDVTLWVDYSKAHVVTKAHKGIGDGPLISVVEGKDKFQQVLAILLDQPGYSKTICSQFKGLETKLATPKGAMVIKVIEVKVETPKATPKATPKDKPAPKAPKVVPSTTPAELASKAPTYTNLSALEEAEDQGH
jgi:hypothetical protein